MTTNGNSPAKKDYSYLWKHEDYWAIWMGLTILIIGLFVFFSSTPANMESTIAKHNAVMAEEAKKAPFKTLEWYQASDAKSSLSVSGIPLIKTFNEFASRPKGWSDNPMASFYLSEADAKAKSAAAAGRYDTAKKATVAALADAKTAQGAAATAQFKDAALNKAASDKVENWRKARTAESRAKGAAETKPYNLIPGMIVMIIVCAKIFGYFFTLTQSTQALVAWVSALEVSRWVILALILFGYLVLGCLMDQVAILILTIPIVLPVIKALGFDPVWFGVIVILMAEVGLVTPPVGLNVFVVARYAKRPLAEIFGGVWPHVFSHLLLVALLVAFPQIILWLPAQMGG